ncbi:hypothetical protein QE430_001980 [Microbacterium testaceum]|nr:hypothetical protein [Microbacterium testaceum]
MRADDDLGRGDVDGRVVVGGVLFAAPGEHVALGLGAAGEQHAVLAVAGEGEVAGSHRVGGADLHGLLAAAGRPQGELALALQGDALGVETTGEHHVAVEGAEFVRREVGDPGIELGVGDTSAVRLEQAEDVVDVVLGVVVVGSSGRRVSRLGVRHRHPSRCGPWLLVRAGAIRVSATAPTWPTVRAECTPLKTSSSY